VGTISGVVFNDIDGDGEQDVGDVGLGGVTIDLLDHQNNVISTTVTAGDGSYKFPNVAPGVYIVRESDPDGFTSTSSNQAPVSVTAGGIGIANFGDQQSSTISGVVFNDANGNGAKDNGENSLGGVRVELLDAAGNVITSTVTAGDGSYLFANVTPGNYKVREVDPLGFTSTTPNTVSIGVPAGGSAVANFGDRQAGSISGVVYNDTNSDGKQDEGEKGIGGVVILLLDINNTLVMTTTTTGNGFYDFVNVPPGEYTVRELDPRGYGSTTSNTVPVNLTEGGSATANFGDRQVAIISGVVYHDINTNQAQDATEVGIGGVAVELIDHTGQVVAVTVTASDGSYVFTNVPPGDYTVKEYNTNGSVSTTPDTVSITITPDSPAPSVNFGDLIENPKAISLDRFYAVTQEKAIVLHWQTTSEIETAGFYVFRSEDNNRDHAVRITSALIASHGSGGGDYSFTDSAVEPNVTYTYWLVEVTFDGDTEDYGPIRSGFFKGRVFLPMVRAR
jgi:protocatechuate 3,4-dioxygenase beta subunit